MPKTMQAIVKPRAGAGLELREVPVPTIGAREALVKTRAMSICGTDLHILHWDPWAANRLKPPLIVGHEFCGDVVEIGRDVTQIKTGDFVSAESHIIDNTCDLCRTGNGHICRNTKIIGVDRDGCYAEYVAMPAENLWLNPPDMRAEIAALMENFGNAVHTGMATPVVARKVLVTGCGPVGLMTILVARAAGARSIYATDISDYRLNLARQLGATLTINVTREKAIEKIFAVTDGEGVDVLLEMSGAPSAIRDGFALLKKGGAAALLGLPGKAFEFDLGDLVILRGITVYGIAGRKLWDTWYEARGLIRSGAVDLSPIITHKFKMADFEKAFATMESGESGKVVMIP
ncbi:MAG: L-threonine 3-dehydrogenase [Chloroflexi bacterium]|nr:L-threonine 3-dehydrogenase [Chloroflexota bacterium]